MRLINLTKINDALTDKLGIFSATLTPHSALFFELQCYDGLGEDTYLVPYKDIMTSTSDESIVDYIVEALGGK